MGFRRIYAPWIERRWTWCMVWVDQKHRDNRGLEREKRVKDWFQWQRPFLKRTKRCQKRAIWVIGETCDMLEVAGMPTVNGWNCTWNASQYIFHGTTFPPETGERSLGKVLLLMGCLSQKSFWKQGEELIILLHVLLGLPGACPLPGPLILQCALTLLLWSNANGLINPFTQGCFLVSSWCILLWSLALHFTLSQQREVTFDTIFLL